MTSKDASATTAVSAGDPATDPFFAMIFDQRFSARAWSVDPDEPLVAGASGLGAGRARDLGGGPGRNAIRLARAGWSVSGVDALLVGFARAAERAFVHLELMEADVLTARPPAASADLIVAASVHRTSRGRGRFFADVAAALGPGGHRSLLGYHLDALGRSGPAERDRLFAKETVRHLLGAFTPVLWRRERPKDDAAPPIDIVAWATAPARVAST